LLPHSVFFLPKQPLDPAAFINRRSCSAVFFSEALVWSSEFVTHLSDSLNCSWHLLLDLSNATFAFSRHFHQGLLRPSAQPVSRPSKICEFLFQSAIVTDPPTHLHLPGLPPIGCRPFSPPVPVHTPYFLICHRPPRAVRTLFPKGGLSHSSLGCYVQISWRSILPDQLPWSAVFSDPYHDPRFLVLFS